MTKEQIEKAKDELSFFNEGDYITREMANSANILEEYIRQLEIKAEVLDKITDKLKEMNRKYTEEYKKIEKLDLIDENTAVLQELSCFLEDIDEIIEGEKK